MLVEMVSYSEGNRSEFVWAYRPSYLRFFVICFSPFLKFRDSTRNLATAASFYEKSY